ncbi:hypothetical protein KP509_20G079200 [Ceratopteris richardii]|uniref:AMP-dependent synthetase/ligase domain-containing protein n=1 Tax=Ceratopteris richardii TaxID=49495 RepID=A0A8T2SK63_CERRI|nr:hypothetical protein KP509_20G079200 [Ceratopteris richardii]
MAPVFLGILLPVALGLVMKSRSDNKKRGVLVEAGGEPGITMRNQRFLKLLETPWEGANTLADLFEQACKMHATQKFLGTRELLKKELEPTSDGRTFEKVTLGRYVWLSYGEAFEQACYFASGIVALGHQKGERCAIFSETRADWIIALQGCFRHNFSVVTVYASLGEEALVHSLNETEVTTVICDQKQMKKVLDLGTKLETVKRVVYMSELGGSQDPSNEHIPDSWTVESFEEVINLGRKSPVEPELPTAESVAVIMYTSGSTGLPKGVVMTHGNMVATVAGVSKLVPELGPKDVYLAYLPLAHVLELAAESVICASGGAIGYGSPLTLTDTSSKIKKGSKGDAAELSPTLMAAVPAILDRVRDGVRKMVDAKGGLSKTIFELAYRRRLAAIEGSWLGAWGPEKILWDTLVFKRIRAVLGGRVRGMLSGGAPLSGDTQRFMNICMGMPIGQGYGLTETCAGASFSEWDDLTVGRVGPPVPHCYLKLINWEEGGYRITDSPMPRGEIVIGGPSVTLGYFKNQAKTDEVYKIFSTIQYIQVDETGMRWFYTGDIGQFHSDGCLEIIDRKKDIVKLQHGEYVSLGKVEAVLIVSPYVDNIMVHADPFHSYVIAILVASQPALEGFARSKDIQFESFEDLCEKEEAIKEVLQSLQKVAKSARLEKFEVPAKIKLLSEPWTPESGLVTAALKLKRENLRKNFSDELKKLYL